MDTISDVAIENLTNWLKSLRLNSGVVLHIPPRSTSQVISGVEVQDNAEVEKLLQRCSISVHEHEIVVSTPEVKLNPDPEKGSTPSIEE